MGVAFLLMLVVSIGVFAMGFRPERPGGGHEVAIQYALLLPGPTGIYIEFMPTFAE